MIRAFRHEAGRLVPCTADADAEAPAGKVWIDVVSPDAAEVAHVAEWTGIELPTRAEMAEIEPSSRLYVEEAAAFMTATLPVGSDGPEPGFAPVTFVLTAGALVTLRYAAPMPFQTYPERAEQTSLPPDSPQGVLLGLLDEIVDRIADLLERTSGEIDQQSRTIFAPAQRGEVRSDDFQRALTTIGGRADYVARLRACLVSLERVLGFLAHYLQRVAAGTSAPKAEREAARAALKTQMRDVAALTQHADALTQQTTLLLDATLGLINIEQSKIIKIFSVVAFVMLPPTLIASIYGMNFEYMPELGWRFGYPAALGAMVVSALLPYLYFKRKGWL